MPFKTRKKKIKASSRSFTFAEGTVSIVGTGKESAEAQVPKKNVQAGMGEQISRKGGIEDLSYLRLDLVKIILLSVFIGAAQIALALTLSK